jgi:hypothetical protein
MVGCAVSTAAASGAEGPGSGRRELPLLFLASAALVTVLYLLPPTIFESEDYVKLHAINRAYLVRSLLSGRVPLWNPHVGLGRPFLADIETAAFYPPNLLYLFLEPHLCLALLLAAHGALLLGGWLRLGRLLGMDDAPAWLTGIAFAASGAVVGTIHKGLIPYADAIAWLPLLFLLAVRLQDGWSARRAADLALGLGLQLLCGHPQIAWLTWFGLAVFLAGRGIGGAAAPGWRPLAAGLGGLAVGLAGGLSLAAVQLLPFFELVGQGNRSSPSVRFASLGALPWAQWASLVLPAGAGPPIAFGASFYIGSTLTVAGLAGLIRLRDRNVRGLAAVTVVGVLYSVGERTPLFALLYRIVPGLSSFRFPGRMGVIVSLALLLAAGMFLAEKMPRRSALLACAGASVVVLVAVAIWRADLPGEAPLAGRLVRGFLAACGLVLLVLRHLRAGMKTRARRWTVWGIAAIALLEIALTSRSHRPFRAGLGPFPGERAVVGMLANAGLLRSGAPPPRVFVPYPLIRDNSGMLHGFSNPSGYVALTLRSVWLYLHESLGLVPPLEDNTFPSARIYDFGPFPYRAASLVLGYDRATSRLVWNPDPGPRAYVESEADARAEIASYEPERVVTDVDAPRAGTLVMAEAWYPGWRATVNGGEAACRQANTWMRAVAVPAGRSRVVMTFRSSYLGLGAVITMASLGLCLAARGGLRAGRPPTRP